MKLRCLSAFTLVATFSLLLATSHMLHAEDELEPSPGARKNLKAFPQAGDGQVRYVIWLPHKTRAEEVDWEVELIPGKQVMGDTANRVMLKGGEMTEKNIEGWGFTYFEVKPFGPTASTLVGGGTPVKKFAAAKSIKTNYNSRLPLVVIGPEDMELHYRLWSVQGGTQNADKE